MAPSLSTVLLQVVDFVDAPREPHPKKKPSVCLIEKENRLGGRIYDVALDPAQPGLVYGLGALRVMETQDYVFSLASELGITLEAAPYRDDLISARGHFAFNSDDLDLLAYPFVPSAGSGDSNTETALYDELRFGPERPNANAYPDFRSYVRGVVGEQGYHFLTDMFRFRGDFEYPFDARGYLDFLDEEWDVCCTPSYPVGGMSQFILKMAAKAQQNGVQIALSQPVTEIWKKGKKYEIRTATGNIHADRLILAVDSTGLRKIGGDIADAIKAMPQFNDLIGVRVVSINQRWPNAWWLNAGYPGKDIRRAWTTERCLNFIEIPVDAYAANQLVTRTVYDDDMRCVAFWENAAAQGMSQVNAEIMNGLHYLFPNAVIPQPLNTVVKVWPAAWYWLRAGTTFTNADIAAWAIEPLAGEDVSLVGDSYNPQRAGWSDAAYKSSINTLNAKYGFNIIAAAHRPAARRGTVRSQAVAR